MAKLKVLILGAGFGGLEVAARLSESAPEQVDVTLVDQSDAFVFGFSKLDVMFGRTTLPRVRARYAEPPLGAAVSVWRSPVKPTRARSPCRRGWPGCGGSATPLAR